MEEKLVYPRRVNYLGGDGQDRMERNGWRMEIADYPGESQDTMYTRLSEKWEDVRIYWCGTMIPGIHSLFAMCKGRKN